MTTLRRYKPLPALADLDPGIEPGWQYDVLILPAEPMDRVGKILLAGTTVADEKGAAVEALLVAISPTAFKSADWVANSDAPPYQVGDHILNKRYPAACEFTGADGRTYVMVKDTEIIGKRVKPAGEVRSEQAA
jgi:hypothetical protein